MLYRFNRLFNVSKTRAAVISVLCALASIPFFFDPVFAMIGGALLGYAFIYGCIWLYKFNRDKRIVEQSKLAEKQAPAQQVIEMTTPSSYRLFPPKPLDRP